MADSSITITPENFDAEVIKSEVPVVVDFWAEWCGPCKMIGPVLDELATEWGGKAKVAKVDVMTNQELAAKYGVRSIPALFFFKGGEVKDKVVGAVAKDIIAQKMSALV